MQEIQVMDSDSSLIVINLQKGPSHQCRRALAPCWMECGGKNGDILDSTLARQTFFELNSIGRRTTPRFLNGRCVAILADDGDVNLISAPVFTSSMNLPINIEQEIRSTLSKKSVLATSEEIWQQCERRNLFVKRGKSVGVCQLPGYTLSLAHQRPLLKSRPLGGSFDTTPLFWNFSEYFLSWIWCFPTKRKKSYKDIRIRKCFYIRLTFKRFFATIYRNQIPQHPGDVRYSLL